ncbi:DUF1697 domain-containing protein [Ornithinimicrobium murale]|uniref:DUF1697 domain-containing protein n=1 Tax=Ornithinimicrobium murale TaxID=1050153 RepID=UPI000E0D7ABA|nr:DUF1697 domain-containing protein [Ornithinimicrobium murale]
MPTYVGFLRAVNLGAKRRFPKDDLRAVTEAAGFTDVATYLNTGNVRVTSRMRSTARVEDALETAFTRDRGFEVPTIVLGLAELSEIVSYAEVLAAEHGPLQRHYVSLVREPLPAAAAERVEAASGPKVTVAVRGRSVHQMWEHAVPGDVDPLGAATSRLLGVTTARTAGVLTEVARRWG